MKKFAARSSVRALVAGAILAAAGAAIAEPVSDVAISNASQLQGNNNVYQLMDIGSVVGPVTSNGKSFVRSISPFSQIQQNQLGVNSVQELYVGTVYPTAAGGSPESNVRVNNIAQTQAALNSLQRMEVGTVGIGGFGGVPLAPMAAGKSNVVVTGTLAQAQAGINNVQLMRVGTIRPF